MSASYSDWPKGKYTVLDRAESDRIEHDAPPPVSAEQIQAWVNEVEEEQPQDPAD